MQRMQRLYTIAAVVTGSGTAAGELANVIPTIAAVVGAICAVISTIAALYYHRKNYIINEKMLDAGLVRRGLEDKSEE